MYYAPISQYVYLALIKGILYTTESHSLKTTALPTLNSYNLFPILYLQTFTSFLSKIVINKKNKRET